MIDETGKNEWSEEPGGQPPESAGQQEAAERVGAAERAGFCQQCGRELTNATVRRAGSAVYCEPCLMQRLGETGAGGPATAGAGAGAAGSAGGPTAAVPPYPPPPQPGPGVNDPNPGLAALLGLIPGVGAMYNGQYAKGVAHLVIFAVLVSLSDNVNGIFGLLVTGWVIYQAFDAYHTAKARRDGTPLPNPFGLNDIGDRMGFGKNWPGSASRPVTSAPAAGWSAGTTATPNWAGYVPPTHFGAAATPPPPAGAGAEPVTATGPAGYGPAYTGPTYTGPVYTGSSTGSSGTGPYAGAGMPVMPMPMGRRFPIGALWLIGLGLLFLLSNLDWGWRIRGRWLVPILLAALAVWLLSRRVWFVRQMVRLHGEEEPTSGTELRLLVHQVRGPVMLLVLAVLFALQSASLFTLGQSWPVLLIAGGGLLLLERTVGGAWIGGAAGPGVPPVAGAPLPRREDK